MRVRVRVRVRVRGPTLYTTKAERHEGQKRKTARTTELRSSVVVSPAPCGSAHCQPSPLASPPARYAHARLARQPMAYSPKVNLYGTADTAEPRLG